jgi:gliding motility-associated-like protein
MGAIDTFYYYGNPRSNAIFDFKTPVVGTKLLSGSDAGPYIVRFDSSGTYRIRMQVNNFGCVGDESFFTVTVRPSPAAYATSKEDACVDEVVNIALYNTTSMITRYDYDWASGKIVYSTATGGPYGIAWNSPGLKVVKLVATTVGCPSRTTYDSIMVHDYPDGRIANVSATNICAGDSVLLRASETDSNAHFVWKPDNFFASGNIYEAWGVVKKSGYIKLTVTSRYGCISSDSALITTQPCCELYFPNAFTPNGDGRNDLFRPVTRGHHEIASFRVVNRWGQTVFETKEEPRGWDGTYNGKDQDAGSYYYYIKYLCREKDWLEQKGEFLLLR